MDRQTDKVKPVYPPPFNFVEAEGIINQEIKICHSLSNQSLHNTDLNALQKYQIDFQSILKAPLEKMLYQFLCYIYQIPPNST